MGGWFTDSPRSAGTLSVIGTMFAVILAFVIFLALQSYQRARQAASEEAIAINELHSIAAVFQPADRNAPDTYENRSRERHAVRRARHSPSHLRAPAD